jgi:hypothetical protein
MMNQPMSVLAGMFTFHDRRRFVKGAVRVRNGLQQGVAADDRWLPFTAFREMRRGFAMLVVCRSVMLSK